MGIPGGSDRGEESDWVLFPAKQHYTPDWSHSTDHACIVQNCRMLIEPRNVIMIGNFHILFVFRSDGQRTPTYTIFYNVYMIVEVKEAQSTLRCTAHMSGPLHSANATPDPIKYPDILFFPNHPCNQDDCCMKHTSPVFVTRLEQCWPHQVPMSRSPSKCGMICGLMEI